MHSSSNQVHQERKVHRDQIALWLESHATKMVLLAFQKAKEDLVERLLLDSNNIDDPNLDRRVNHVSGALRTIEQLLNKEELINLLDDHELLYRETE